jgi:hypothetical protein
MNFTQEVLSVKIHTEYVVWAVPWLTSLAWFVVDEVPLEQVFSRHFGFPL